MKLVGKSGASNKAGRDITIASQSGSTITVTGDITAFNYFIGEQYEFLYTFLTTIFGSWPKSLAQELE